MSDFFQGLGDMSIIKKLADLLPGKKIEDLSFEERLALYDKMKAQKAREDFLSSRERPKTTTSTTEESSEEEDGDEDEIDFFNYARRFRQPMDYQSILDRAFKGSTDGALLESYKEAMERATA